ncbi:unnamed protein product, partial [Linum tenue]
PAQLLVLEKQHLLGSSLALFPIAHHVFVKRPEGHNPAAEALHRSLQRERLGAAACEQLVVEMPHRHHCVLRVTSHVHKPASGLPHRLRQVTVRHVSVEQS